MSVRSVIVRLEAEVAGYIAGMGKAAQATDKVSKASEQTGKANEKSSAAAAAAAAKHKDALDQVGSTATIAGAATVAGVGLAIKTYADFDKQMSSVRAATHETAENMDLLKQAAVDAGADTAFSAVEAAQGIEELAKAGVSTKDVLSGGLDGALDLAAAGALEVGTAAEIAASAMTQFKLSGDQIPHLADLLAAGAGKAQGSVEDLGAALNQSGLVAASTGATVEETTGALAAFASAGLTGSDAGTSFKTMLMSLNPNSKEASELMEQLGISAYDANGEFVGMSEYAGILQNALKGMSDEQRNATLKTLFGSDAVRAATVMYEQGAEGIQKWEDAVNDAGYAAETAAMMQDNLAGDLEKLGGAFDTVLLQSGSGANGVLRDMVQGLEGVVDAIGKVPAPVLSAVTGLAAVLGGAGLLAGGLITVIPKIRDTRDALNELAPAGGKARTALDRVGAAATGAATIGTLTMLVAKLAEADYMSKIDVGMGKVADALAEVTTNGPGAGKALDALFQDRDGGNLIQGVEDLNTAMQRTFNKNSDQEFNDWAEGIVNGVTGVKGSSQILEDSFKRVDESLAGLVSSGKAGDAAKAFSQLEAAAKLQGATVEEVAAKFPAYNDALKAASAEQKTTATTAPVAAETIGDVGTAAEQAAEQADSLVESLLAMNNVNLSAADAQLGFDQAIADSAKNLANAGHGVDYLNEKTGEFNQIAADNMEMLNGIASQGNKVAQTVYDQSGSYDEFKASLEGSRQALFDVAKAYYPTEEAAWAYVDSVMAIPPEMKTTVDITDNGTIEGVKGNLKLLHEAIQGTPDKTVIIKEPMSPAVKKGLENLGYIVTHLPDGTIQVSETGTTATGQKIDNTAGKRRIATIDAQAITGAAENALNYAARARNSVILQEIRQSILPVGGDAPPASIARRAGGGDISGPGTSTSDSVLIAASDGEHMLDRGDVIKMGGQQAVYRFRRELQAGTFQRLAAGGHVGTRAAATQLMVQGGAAPRISLEGLTVLVTNPFTGEQVNGIVRGVARHEANGAVAAADAQSQYTRRG